MGRTATAIGCALVFLAGCGGEVTAVAQRATTDREADGASPAAPGTDSGVDAVPDAQSEAALEALHPDSAAALTGPAECAAAGGQCEEGAVCGLALGTHFGPCGPGGTVCCLDVVCPADATVQIIEASDYDQSCAVDSDCAEIYVGNGCSCELSCRASPAAINMAALQQYTSDVAKFRMPCGCPPPPPPCANQTYPGPGPHCVGGMCQITPCPG
jgi:hypothetical protein